MKTKTISYLFLCFTLTALLHSLALAASLPQKQEIQRYDTVPSLKFFAMKKLYNSITPSGWKAPRSQMITIQETQPQETKFLDFSDMPPTFRGPPLPILFSSGPAITTKPEKRIFQKIEYSMWDLSCFIQEKDILNNALEKAATAKNVTINTDAKNYFLAAALAYKYLALLDTHNNDYDCIVKLLQASQEKKIKIGSNQTAHQALAVYCGKDDNGPGSLIKNVKDIKELINVIYHPKY